MAEIANNFDANPQFIFPECVIVKRTVSEKNGASYIDVQTTGGLFSLSFAREFQAERLPLMRPIRLDVRCNMRIFANKDGSQRVSFQVVQVVTQPKIIGAAEPAKS